MIFKNAQVIAFTKPFVHTIEELNKMLSEFRFKPLEENKMSSVGWVNPLGSVSQVDDDYFLASSGGVILVKYYVEKKDIKKKTIQKKLAVIEEETIKEHGRSLTKREKLQHTETIIEELLPHAQTIEKAVCAYISPKDNVLVVNSATDSDTEDVCALLRKSLGSLPCTRVGQYVLVKEGEQTPRPEEVFTSWVTKDSDLPKGLFIGNSCSLSGISSENKAKATFKEQDLQTEEIKSFIESTYLEVKELSLVLYVDDIDNFEQIMSFTINKNLDIKSIKIFDNVLAENPFSEDEEGAELSLFEGDFLINVKYINLAFEVIHKVFKTSAKACIDEALGDFDLINCSIKSIRNYFSAQLSQVVLEQEDPLFEEAKEFIVNEKSFSISKIQRKFRVGYNRAARIVELVKNQGVEVNGK